jgi:hypothetical protein
VKEKEEKNKREGEKNVRDKKIGSFYCFFKHMCVEK